MKWLVRALAVTVIGSLTGTAVYVGTPVPTLILWGGQDRLIPPSLGDRFDAQIADSRLVRFEQLGHVPHEEDPPGTVAVVEAFLAESPPSPAD
jgi:pimeloyl-ACP methyl ester carboxylesterase